MATIADELNAISVEHGYTGAAPKTIADAIDALADTLAGTDVKSGRSIAGAIHALAPYIGSGGGGAELGPLVGMIAGGAKENEEINVYVSTTPYDITSGETYSDALTPVYSNTNVLGIQGNSVSISAPSGCYVVILATVPNGWTTDSLNIHDAGYSQQITSGFECRVFSDDYYTNALFTMQIPANGLTVDFGNGLNVGD